MIKYICNLCKKEIWHKGVVMKVKFMQILENDNNFVSECELHFHEVCARRLIGDDAIKEEYAKERLRK